MRITSQMMMSRYKRDVSDAYSSMNKAMRHAYDYRAFDRPSDAPLAAAQTFEVHWQMGQNADYSANVQNMQGVSNTADGILQNIDKILTEANGTNTLKAINGDMNESNRGTIAKQLLYYRDSIMEKLNAKYGDSYIFGGSNSGSAPFQMINDQLYYRGVNVDTGENLNGASAQVGYNYKDSSNVLNAKTMQVNFGKDIGNKLNGYTIEINTTAGGSLSSTVNTSTKKISIQVSNTTTKGDLQTYLQGSTFAGQLGVASTSGITISGLPENAGDVVTPPSSSTPSTISDVVDMNALANEKVYVDIGLGITSTNGKVDDQSAFNGSFPGISFLGYGTKTVTNGDGTYNNIPNNICSILTNIANDLKNYKGTSNTDLIKQVSPYIDSFNTAQSNFQSMQTQMGQQTVFLNDTADYLSDMKINLSDKDNNVEYVDYTDAIEDFYSQSYCYNAALKVGGQILQQSLMDYLK